MRMAPEKPQRVTVFVEHNKGGTWGIAAYLAAASGRRYRWALRTCSTYEEAVKVMKTIWKAMNGPGESSAPVSNDEPIRAHVEAQG